MRRPPSWALTAAALVLLPGCHETEAEQLQRELVNRARERNAVVAAALTALVVVALRWVPAQVRSRRRTAGWPPPTRPAPVLLAAALASDGVGLLALSAVGAGIGYVAGPTPAPDVGLDGLGIALFALYLVPVGALGLVVALLLFLVARRVPDVGTGLLVLAVLVLGIAAAVGGSVAANASDARWAAFGAVGCVEGVVGATGYAWTVVMRVRYRRAARAGH